MKRSQVLNYAVVIGVGLVLATGVSLKSFWLIALGVALLVAGYERERREAEAKRIREDAERLNIVNNQGTVIIYASELRLKGWKQMVRQAVQRIRSELGAGAAPGAESHRDTARHQDCKSEADCRSAPGQRPDSPSASDGRRRRKGPQSAQQAQPLGKCAGV